MHESPSQTVSINPVQPVLMGLASVLSNHRCHVQGYQREYAWTHSQAQDFSTDIENAIVRRTGFYFFGAVILRRQETGSYEVIDGQQRLATTALFIKACSDIVALTDSVRAKKLSDPFLLETNPRDDSTLPTLVLNPADDPFFSKLMRAEPAALPTPLTASEKRILGVYTFFRESYSELVSKLDNEQAVDFLWERFKFLKESATCYLCVFPSGSNAYTLFESLNGRGLPLSTVELIKNALFARCAPEHIQSTERAFNEMCVTASAGSKVDPSKGIEAFLRHAWISRYGVVRAEDLFRDVRSKVSTSEDSREIAVMLAKDADVYRGLVQPSPDRWSTLPGVFQSLARLSIIGFTQCRPILLALEGTVPGHKFLDYLKILEAAGIRRLIGGRSEGSVGEALGRLAHKIRESQGRYPARALEKDLVAVLPTEADYQTSLRRYRPKPKLARLMLQVAEAELSGAAPLSDDTAKVDLEHILPISRRGEVTTESGEDLTDRLGNLALILRCDNKTLRDKPYDKKRLVYQFQPFQTTTMIADSLEWGTLEIEKRQEELVPLINSYWPALGKE